MSLSVVRNGAALEMAIRSWADGKIAVVPTMGALHDGHIELVRAAIRTADRVIVTIFVNPTQFDDPADLAAYPGGLENDVAKLQKLAVDLVYAPGPDDMYPDGFSTAITVSGVGEGLCGDHRPGHFSGVATVVCKLLTRTCADIAFFGEKDYQQLLVVRRMAADLDLKVKIAAVPTVRDSQGLALSSRNEKIPDRLRCRAPMIHVILQEVAASICNRQPVGTAVEEGVARLIQSGFDTVEYLELRSETDLRPLDRLDRPARLLVAARLGGVRLIDNLAIRPAGTMCAIQDGFRTGSGYNSCG